MRLGQLAERLLDLRFLRPVDKADPLLHSARLILAHEAHLLLILGDWWPWSKVYYSLVGRWSQKLLRGHYAAESLCDLRPQVLVGLGVVVDDVEALVAAFGLLGSPEISMQLRGRQAVEAAVEFPGKAVLSPAWQPWWLRRG